METKYRIGNSKKRLIAENLIAAMESDATIERETRRFIAEWIMTDAAGKTKAFYDVWDYVLRNYMPTTRPMLYRTCTRRKNGKIESYTGSFATAVKFSNSKGILLICDTKMSLAAYRPQVRGEYAHTFFPLGELLKKERERQGRNGKPSLCESWIGEDEYIMRTNLNWTESLKWCNQW